MRLALSLMVMCGIVWAQDKQEEKPAEEPREEAPSQRETSPQERTIFITDSPLNPKDPHDIPYSVDRIDYRKKLERMPRTMPRMLDDSPNVSVQETGPSQGSPFIRGLTSYHTVLLIDGIRLNHSGMRSGPNQYWGTVDPYMIQSMELVRGPSSVLYGSDAIGGTVAVTTIDPDVEPGTNVHTRTYGRYSSAERSFTGRQEFSGNFDDLGWVVGGTYKVFNDLRGGRAVGVMNNTGYDEYDADIKFVYRVNENSRLVIAAQHHRLEDGNRWHSTADSISWHGTATGSDIFRRFDQERDLYYLQYHWKGEGGLVDAVSASLSWHRQAEQTDRLRTPTRREEREFEIDTPAAWLRVGKKTGIGYVTAGAEYYHDIVSSAGQDINPGPIPFTRGIIADDATYRSLGVYVQDEFSIGRLDVTPGIRFSTIDFEADVVDPVVGGSPIVDSMEDSYSAVTGSLRFLYHLDDHWNAIAGWGMGFRAPSLHDSTSTDLVLSGSEERPAANLDPEFAHSFDVGLRARYPRWQASAFAFYTLLQDFLRRVPIGDVSVPADGVTDFSRANFSDGYIYGYELQALYRLTDEVTVWADWGYAWGKSDVVGGGEEPLSKMNPGRGHVGLRFQPEKSAVWVEGIVTFADDQSNQSSADKGDTQRQPLGGTPGYAAYGVRGGYAVNENVEVTAAVENVSDKDYRIHGSGQNRPGTNFILGLDIQF